jgi:hypothetical protein
MARTRRALGKLALVEAQIGVGIVNVHVLDRQLQRLIDPGLEAEAFIDRFDVEVKGGHRSLTCRRGYRHEIAFPGHLPWFICIPRRSSKLQEGWAGHRAIRGRKSTRKAPQVITITPCRVLMS